MCVVDCFLVDLYLGGDVFDDCDFLVVGCVVVMEWYVQEQVVVFIYDIDECVDDGFCGFVGVVVIYVLVIVLVVEVGVGLLREWFDDVVVFVFDV